MDGHTYPYLSQTSRRSRHASYRPSLPIIISSGEKSRLYLGLVDSGTDITMADSRIAEWLGITNRSYPATASGLGEWIEGFLAPVTIQVPQFEEILQCTVLFVPDLMVDVILGQDDFFMRFDVCFKRKKKSFHLDLSV